MLNKLAGFALSAALCWGQGSKWAGFCFSDGTVPATCQEFAPQHAGVPASYNAVYETIPTPFNILVSRFWSLPDQPFPPTFGFVQQQYMCWAEPWAADRACDERTYTIQKLARALIKYEHHPSGGLLYVGQYGAHADAGGYAQWGTPELSRAGLERDLARKFAREETLEQIINEWGGRGKRVQYAERLLKEMRE